MFLQDSPLQLRKPLSILFFLVAAFLILRVLLFTIFPTNADMADRRSTESQKDRPLQISLLSWNIWFSPFKMAERMTALGDVINEMRPEIIALQEVTHDNIALLKTQSWYHRYNLIPSDIGREDHYFVVILSVFPAQRSKTINYPFPNSRMSRKLVAANLDVNGHLMPHLFITVGTSHLESIAANTLQRESQLEEAFTILSENDNVCLVGDLNLEENVDGEILLPNPWFDAWLSLPGNSEKNGYTWNPIINTMMPDKQSKQERFDRVFCKLRDFKVKKMSIVGNRPTNTGVFPSDHFGLYTLLENTKRDQHSNQQTSNRVQKQLEFKRPRGHAN